MRRIAPDKIKKGRMPTVITRMSSQASKETRSFGAGVAADSNFLPRSGQNYKGVGYVGGGQPPLFIAGAPEADVLYARAAT